MLTMCWPGVASSAQGVVQAVSGRLSSIAVASAGTVDTAIFKYGLAPRSWVGRGRGGGSGMGPRSGVVDRCGEVPASPASPPASVVSGVVFGAGGIGLGLFSSSSGGGGEADGATSGGVPTGGAVDWDCGAGGCASVATGLGPESVIHGAACHAINPTSATATSTANSTGSTPTLR